nr:UPF0587 protein C1orf123 homolog [Ipomoea batatas]
MVSTFLCFVGLLVELQSIWTIGQDLRLNWKKFYNSKMHYGDHNRGSCRTLILDSFTTKITIVDPRCTTEITIVDLGVHPGREVFKGSNELTLGEVKIGEEEEKWLPQPPVPLKCGCGEVTEKETCVSLNETVPLPTGGGMHTLYRRRSKHLNRNASGGGQDLAWFISEATSNDPELIFSL